MALTIAHAGRIGPMIYAPPTARWVVIKALMPAISAFATLIVNAPDFASRFSTYSTFWANFVDNDTFAERFGVFVISLGFALARFASKLVANFISAGIKLTALLPKIINIRRGGYAWATVGFAMRPHLHSAKKHFTDLASEN
ncbi:hypothetical protein KEM54_004230 [Ascosphaera aggregata]|nr:hypothetical protein KEM54_004230 [Ascosphaera aggregata]